ncbi:hypothetical protein Lferr_2123 [Acidithiobacillus ferrooxidans ATCC 53993]|nr:hypothetical protein Lferr_2123 [Acidithiobacillus ferrooxidans ATCC 53993]
MFLPCGRPLHCGLDGEKRRQCLRTLDKSQNNGRQESQQRIPQTRGDRGPLVPPPVCQNLRPVLRQPWPGTWRAPGQGRYTRHSGHRIQRFREHRSPPTGEGGTVTPHGGPAARSHRATCQSDHHPYPHANHFAFAHRFYWPCSLPNRVWSFAIRASTLARRRVLPLDRKRVSRCSR